MIVNPAIPFGTSFGPGPLLHRALVVGFLAALVSIIGVASTKHLVRQSAKPVIALTEPLPNTTERAIVSELTGPRSATPVRILEVRNTAVLVEIHVNGRIPKPGTRVALVLSGVGEKGIPVVADAEIERGTARWTHVVVKPHDALMLREISGIVDLDYEILPAEGRSPYVGKTIQSGAELKSLAMKAVENGGPHQILDPRETTSVPNSTPTQEKRTLQPSLIWASGQGLSYLIESSGKVWVVEKDGSRAPLELDRAP